MPLSPQTRWAAIVGPRTEGIKALINEVFQFLPVNLTSKIVELVDKDADKVFILDILHSLFDPSHHRHLRLTFFSDSCSVSCGLRG